jgi:pimeloyl-ACP methyl ester carboxylesterase
MMVSKGYKTVSHGQIHYRMTAERGKRPLLFLHQTPSSSATYEALMTKLAADFWCIAPDTPGFGQSDQLANGATIAGYATAVCQFLHASNIQNCAVFGHHTGGSIAVQLAFDHPERVTKLAISGPPLLTGAQIAHLKTTLPSLRSDLFEGKALAGVWELAVYPPAEGELITPMALSLDIEPGERELAVSAMEQFLAELEEVWPVRRSDYRLGEHEGACLGNVRVMPDLAPCYLATPEALMVGWSSRSLEMALAENDPGGGPGADPEGSGGRVFFSRFPAADRVIAGATGAPGPVDRSFYPWDLLELTGGRDEAVYRFRARLGPEAAR